MENTLKSYQKKNQQIKLNKQQKYLQEPNTKQKHRKKKKKA